jgi:endonuclease/exonuclease/phosphatase (EEP) superfamily protein YafD
VIARLALVGPIALVGLLSLGAFLAGRGYPGDLLAFFREQYAVVLFVLAVAAAALRKPVLCAVAVVLLLLNVLALAPALTAGARPDPGGRPLRLLVANVEYSNRDFGALGRLVRRERPDIVALVELSPAYAAGIRPALGAYRTRVLSPRDDAFGIGLYSRVPVGDLRITRPIGGSPQVATALVVAGGRKLRLFVVHPPPPITPGLAGDNAALLRVIAGRARVSGSRTLVCGDFNAPPWSPAFRRLLRIGGLERADAWRPWQGTWLRLPEPFRVPIDTCAAGRGLAVAVRTGPAIGSDHRPILVSVG